MTVFRGRLRWLLIFWMFAISAIAYLDRVNISIAGPAIEREFQLGHIQLGWVFSAFALSYALFQAPGGRLADRFGPRAVLTFGAVWWALFTALTAMIPSGWSHALFLMISVRFLLGIGEAVLFPASNRLVASWIPSRERGVANGCIFAGVGAGAAITPPLVTYILVRQGWRWSFWFSALIGLLAGLAWMLLARDTPEKHPWIEKQEVATIAAGVPESSIERANSKPLPWRVILGSRNVLAITLSYFCYGYVAYIFFTWFFIYLRSVRGLDLMSSSYYGMLPFLAMAIGSPLGGWISDRVANRYGSKVGRCGTACASLMLSAVFVAGGSYALDARVASIVLAGGAGALYLSQSAFWTVSSDIAGRSSGSVSGVMNMGSQIGSAITASLTPIIAKHFGWSPSFLVAAALCTVGSLAWLSVDPHRELTRGSPVASPVSQIDSD